MHGSTIKFLPGPGVTTASPQAGPAACADLWQRLPLLLHGRAHCQLALCFLLLLFLNYCVPFLRGIARGRVRAVRLMVRRTLQLLLFVQRRFLCLKRSLVAG